MWSELQISKMNKLELVAYKIFEEEMKIRFYIYLLKKRFNIENSLRMKPHLLEIKETEGDEEFYSNIRNCVAGCKLKWKSMHKVCYFANNMS